MTETMTRERSVVDPNSSESIRGAALDARRQQEVQEDIDQAIEEVNEVNPNLAADLRDRRQAMMDGDNAAYTVAGPEQPGMEAN